MKKEYKIKDNYLYIQYQTSKDMYEAFDEYINKGYKIIDTFNLDENQINKMLKTYYGKHFSMLKSHKIMIFTQFLRIFNYYFYSYIHSETQSEYFKRKAEVCYKKIIADKVR